MSPLRIWLWLTAAVLIGALTWSLAPILIVIAAVTAGLGIVAAVMVALARAIERRRR